MSKIIPNAYLSGYYFPATSPPLVSWEADTGVTSGTIGQAVSDWVSTNGTYTVSNVAPNRPTNVAAFTTGHGVDFDGTNDCLYMNSNPFSASAGTVIIVFQPQSIGSDQVLISTSDNALADEWFEIGVTAAGRIYIERSTSGAAARLVGSSILTANTSYILCVTKDSNGYFVTLNNVEENPLTVSTTMPSGWLGSPSTTTPEFLIGACFPNGGATRFFNGLIGVVRIWNTDITH